MPRIILLRHGQASFGAADYDVLSDLGRRQARLAGTVLAGRGLREPLVVAGTLQRQRDTAALAMAEMGLDGGPDVDGRWDEYDHVGMVEARLEEDSPPLDPRAFQGILDSALAEWIDADDPAGWRGFSGGAAAALSDLADRIGARDAVVATSGGVIAAVCGRLLGLGAAGVVALNRVTVNAAFTTILSGRSGLSLLTFNDHAHLTGDAAALRTYR